MSVESNVFWERKNGGQTYLNFPLYTQSQRHTRPVALPHGPSSAYARIACLVLHIRTAGLKTEWNHLKPLIGGYTPLSVF